MAFNKVKFFKKLEKAAEYHKKSIYALEDAINELESFVSNKKEPKSKVVKKRKYNRKKLDSKS